MTLDLNTWMKNHWINPIPYPIKLKYIHVMVTEESEGVSPKIYSWDLKGDPVPVNGKVFFDSKKMPDWIDFNPQTIRAWIDYQVLPCKPCDDAIINASLGGTSRSSSRYITFELFDVIQQTQAKFLQIDMRSKQANPGNQESIDLLNSLKISQDGGYTAGPLYIDSFQKPSFEYRISLIMPDGTQFKGEKWISSQDLEIYLGYKNIMEQIPEFTANQDQ